MKFTERRYTTDQSALIGIAVTMVALASAALIIGWLA